MVFFCVFLFMMNLFNNKGSLIKIVNKIKISKNVFFLLVFVIYGNFYIVLSLIVDFVVVKIKLSFEDY